MQGLTLLQEAVKNTRRPLSWLVGEDGAVSQYKPSQRDIHTPDRMRATDLAEPTTVGGRAALGGFARQEARLSGGGGQQRGGRAPPLAGGPRHPFRRGLRRAGMRGRHPHGLGAEEQGPPHPALLETRRARPFRAAVRSFRHRRAHPPPSRRPAGFGFHRVLPLDVSFRRRRHPRESGAGRRRKHGLRRIHLSGCELVRARSVRHVRHPLRRPFQSAPHSHAGVVGGPSAAQRTPGARHRDGPVPNDAGVSESAAGSPAFRAGRMGHEPQVENTRISCF